MTLLEAMKPITMDEIHTYTGSPDWQIFRISLVGLPTTTKLQELEIYLNERDNETEARRIRVVNYLNALKRGGFITSGLEVVK